MKTIDSCKSDRKSLLICKPSEPFYNIHTRPICETHLLFQESSIPKSCDIRILSSNIEIWHKLKSSNSWLYVLPKAIDVTINCPPQAPQTFIFNSTGVLTLAANCKLFTSTTTIISENTDYEGSMKAIIPDFQLEMNDCCEQNKTKTVNDTHNIQLSPVNIISLDKDTLNLIGQKLDDMDKTADQLISDSNFKIFQNSYFIYFLCTLIKIIGLFILDKIFKRLRRKCCSNANDKCYNITNKLTLNMCKKSNKVSVEIDEKQETIELRRSPRLVAQIKEKI